jgi:hypothetical protein
LDGTHPWLFEASPRSVIFTARMAVPLSSLKSIIASYFLAVSFGHARRQNGQELSARMEPLNYAAPDM